MAGELLATAPALPPSRNQQATKLLRSSDLRASTPHAVIGTVRNAVRILASIAPTCETARCILSSVPAIPAGTSYKRSTVPAASPMGLMPHIAATNVIVSKVGADNLVRNRGEMEGFPPALRIPQKEAALERSSSRHPTPAGCSVGQWPKGGEQMLQVAIDR